METLTDYQKELAKWIRKTRPKIYCVLRHASQSGMLRVIDFYIIKEGRPFYVSPLIAAFCDYKRDTKKDGLRVSGCGMDMGFAVVYDFSYKVFPKGFRYRKNESHRNGDTSPIDKDGGYALKHEWI